jgi:signal transduction histidine kinase
MRLDSDTRELRLIARALQSISRETTYQGLAEALLGQALAYSKASRGGVLLSAGGQLLDIADASFPRENAKFLISNPPNVEFQLPADMDEAVLGRRETVVREVEGTLSALIMPRASSPKKLMQMALPLVHQEQTIGVLYLESSPKQGLFEPRSVWIMSILASQTAVSFESARLFEALRETNRLMVKGQEIGQMGSYRWNTRTLLSRGSREIFRILGLDPNVNPVPFEAFRDRVHSDDLPALEAELAKALTTRSPFSHEYRVVHEDGTTLSVLAVGQFDMGPTGDLELEGIIIDITAQKAADQALADARAELAQASSLASVGEMAGSIIHEMNQPLTSILMSAEACLRWLARAPAEPEEALESAKRVLEQGRRATDVAASLRSLVQSSQLNLTQVDINDAISEVLLLLKRELELKGIVLRVELDPTNPGAEADRIQLQHVILNLVRNAVEAMTSTEERSRALIVKSKAQNQTVSVSIVDRGTGIVSTAKEHLFEALYTTKPDGLGLGLSICRRIISAHAGQLYVEESTASGTTFVFTIPLHIPRTSMEPQ